MNGVTAPVRPARLHGLDALRGIAALCVVLLHAHVLMPEIPDLMNRGYLAVDFFFVLSGYVMARTYEPRLAAGYRATAFFLARYRRLWPTMAIGGLLFLPFLQEGTRGENIHLWPVIFVNFVLAPSLGSKNLFPLNVPGWSIFFELVGNWVHGVLLWRLREQGLVMVCLICLAGLALAGRIYGNLDIGSDQGELPVGLLRMGFTYTLGVLLWRCWGERQIHSLFGYAALLVLPTYFSLPIGVDTSAWRLDLLFVAVITPLVLIGGLALRRGEGLARAAGEISFPLYAVHYPMLYWSRALGLGPYVAIVAAIVLAALIATGHTAWQRRRKMRLSTA